MIKAEDLEIGDTLVERYNGKDFNYTIVFLDKKQNLITLNINNTNINNYISVILDLLRSYSEIYSLKKTTQSKETLCMHEYKSYVGFTQTYNYCTKCDYKQT